MCSFVINVTIINNLKVSKNCSVNRGLTRDLEEKQLMLKCNQKYLQTIFRQWRHKKDEKFICFGFWFFYCWSKQGESQTNGLKKQIKKFLLFFSESFISSQKRWWTLKKYLQILKICWKNYIFAQIVLHHTTMISFMGLTMNNKFKFNSKVSKIIKFFGRLYSKCNYY